MNSVAMGRIVLSVRPDRLTMNGLQRFQAQGVPGSNDPDRNRVGRSSAGAKIQAHRPTELSALAAMRLRFTAFWPGQTPIAGLVPIPDSHTI